jgi:hypothetical protein
MITRIITIRTIAIIMYPYAAGMEGDEVYNTHPKHEKHNNHNHDNNNNNNKNNNNNNRYACAADTAH